jgi:hypothetical protein
MPFHTIPGTSLQYALLSVDKDGKERSDDPDGRNGKLSARLLERVASEPITNIFLYSHGWKGDVPSAVDQYNRWIKAIEDRADDRAAMTAKVPGFRPLHVGLHWPSQPWGDEELGGAGASFALPGGAAALKETYIERLGNGPDVRAALDVIFEEARANAAADALPARARAAYLALNDALGLGEQGAGAAPADDREAFDPDVAFDQESAVLGTDADFAGFSANSILGPLRQLSYWTMKKRGQTIGEGGFHTLLKSLQQAAPNARFHLMGHSFGCVVMTSMLGGPHANSPLVRPVDSCVLVQGAISLWAYAADIPKKPGTPGYSHRVLTDKKVRGPILTTRSKFDKAVGNFYPIAAGIAGQVDFADLTPLYGGMGSFGIQGAAGSFDQPMLAATQAYAFAEGKIYNLECSNFIKKGDGASGAHSDIDGPEVAHAVWQAALV